MCILTNPVLKVAATKIYASIDQFNERQLTVYANEVSSPTENAMVLPVPHPESVEFVDFSSYPEFFMDCEYCFERLPIRSFTLTANFLGQTPEQKPLPVYDVGSYRASIVPTLRDLHRINTEVFTIGPELNNLLKEHYDISDYGFIVCQLKSGYNIYHPFGYTHKLIKKGRLFLPTRHYHPPAVKKDKLKQIHLHTDSLEADWEHVIYSPMTDLDSTNQDYYRFKTPEFVQWGKLPETYRWACNKRMSRWTKTGNYMNDDLLSDVVRF